MNTRNNKNIKKFIVGELYGRKNFCAKLVGNAFV